MTQTNPELYVNLRGESPESNRSFLKGLYELDLSDAHMYFDKLDCGKSFARESDKCMTLEMYLDALGKTRGQLYFALRKQELGSQNISLMVRGVNLPNSPNDEKFAFYKCPWTHEKENKVRELFKQVYEKDIFECLM